MSNFSIERELCQFVPKMHQSRWGTASTSEISHKIEETTPTNTKKAKEYAWRQFMDFCQTRSYTVDRNTTTIHLNSILQDYAYNMKRKDGTEYKESVIKFNWNVTAKLLQEKFFQEYNIKIDPFTDLDFKTARQARDAKRKELQRDVDKRKKSSDAFTLDEHLQLQKYWPELTPEGLQKKFYFIAAKELAWRGNEGVNAKLQHFVIEKDNFGNETGRIKYNPIFSKTHQGGSKSCTESKWLVRNNLDPNICPVRLFHKLLEKRSKHVTTDRLFLTPNSKWASNYSMGWYKNSPIGINTMSKWTLETAKKVGLDVKNKKFTNHSHRSSAVTHLAQSEVSEQELMKITGHTNSNSLRPYLNMQPKRHEEILNKIRSSCSSVTVSSASTSSSNENSKFVQCTFNIQNFHCN